MGFGGGACGVFETFGIIGTLVTSPLVVGGASLVFSVLLAVGLAAVTGGTFDGAELSSVMECFLVGISGLL